VNFTFTLLDIINKEQIAQKEKFIAYFLILGKVFLVKVLNFLCTFLNQRHFLTIFQTKNKYLPRKTNMI